MFALLLAWGQHFSPTEASAGTALHRVLPPCLHLQWDQDDDGEAAQVCPRRGSFLHLPGGHPLWLRHLLHYDDRMRDCLSSPLPGQARRGQILPWLHSPGTSSITEGVSQSRISSHPVTLLIIDFSGQMSFNPHFPCCSKHYCCRNVAHSLTIANPVRKKKIIDAVSLPYRFFTLCDLSSCTKCTWTKQSLEGRNRPQRHCSLCHSLFIQVLSPSQ